MQAWKGVQRGPQAARGTASQRPRGVLHQRAHRAAAAQGLGRIAPGSDLAVPPAGRVPAAVDITEGQALDSRTRKVPAQGTPKRGY